MEVQIILKCPLLEVSCEMEVGLSCRQFNIQGKPFSIILHYREYFKSGQFIVIQRPNLKAIWKDGYCLPSSGISDITGDDERELGSSEPSQICPSAEKGGMQGGEESHPPCHPPKVW